MRESAWTLTAVNKRGSVKIGAFPFDGDKRKDRQPPAQVFFVRVVSIYRLLMGVVLQ
ncbi:hypothetical protein [Hoylesella buccalis]|uniref:hypothetical protein n=1 Tax=Hoylesella buccalis TaxID=28127 RepID=UPI00288A3272|nr:hypothetical protein [Hoylesella buccalis]